MKLEELVKEFADCVAAQRQAIENGDAKLGNQFAKRYISAFKKLCAQANDGREALVLLLADSRVDVRVMAAAFLLRYKTDEARAVLETEAKGTGIVAFQAEQALQRWNEGTWALDPA